MRMLRCSSGKCCQCLIIHIYLFFIRICRNRAVGSSCTVNGFTCAFALFDFENHLNKMAGYNFKNEDEVKEYLENLYTEYTFGCFSEQNPEVCHNLGEYFLTIKRDCKAALEIYQKNCDTFDFGRSCTKFGTYTTLGKGCEQDVPLGYKYMKKGCEQSNQSGCTNAGIIAITRPEVQQKDKKTVIEEGVKMLNKSCMEQKSEKACFFLAGVYMRGIEGYLEKDGLQAYKLSLKACELGNPLSCANVGQMHLSGDLVEKNVQLAETFRKRAYELHKQMHEQTINFGHGIQP